MCSYQHLTRFLTLDVYIFTFSTRGACRFVVMSRKRAKIDWDSADKSLYWEDGFTDATKKLKSASSQITEPELCKADVYHDIPDNHDSFDVPECDNIFIGGDKTSDDNAEFDIDADADNAEWLLEDDPTVQTKQLDDCVYALLKLAKKHSWTDQCLYETLSLLRTLLPYGNQLPKSVKGLRKYMFAKVKVGLHPTILKYCPKCCRNTSDFCQCGKPTAHFVRYDSNAQLIRIIRKYREEIISYPEQVKEKPGYSDVQSGKTYADKLKRVPSDCFPLSLGEFVDGASYVNSTSNTTWPICVSVHNLAPAHRHSCSNVILLGLWHGTEKPDWNYIARIFDDFYDQILTVDGLKFYVFCSLLTCDLPARASFLNCMGVNACNACIYCKIFGKRENSRMVYASGVYEPRTKDEFTFNATLADAKNAGKKKNVAIGSVRGTSAIHRHLTIPDDIASDGMHTGYCGPPKDDLKKLINGHKEGELRIRSISDGNLREMNQMLHGIQYPYEISRRPQCFQDFTHFKASVWSLYLRFLVPTIVLTTLTETHPQQVHCILLYSAATELVTKDVVTEAELKTAQKLLDEWSAMRGTTFGQSGLTLKAHESTHFPSQVRQHGPLSKHSAFFGEHAIGIYGKFLTCKSFNIAGKQFAERFDAAYQLRIWEDDGTLNPDITKIVGNRSNRVHSTGSCVLIQSDNMFYAMISAAFPTVNQFMMQERIFINSQRFDVGCPANSFVFYEDGKGGFRVGMLKLIFKCLEQTFFVIDALKKSPIQKLFQCNAESSLFDPYAFRYAVFCKTPVKVAATDIVSATSVICKGFSVTCKNKLFVIGMSCFYEHH
uniref:Transposon protein, putative, CACTA, En/Spm sub-class n=1 Tax=Panagrellus redivivus TaxID=6233 RepID=A0A7E4VXP2_PANRE